MQSIDKFRDQITNFLVTKPISIPSKKTYFEIFKIVRAYKVYKCVSKIANKENTICISKNSNEVGE